MDKDGDGTSRLYIVKADNLRQAKEEALALADEDLKINFVQKTGQEEFDVDISLGNTTNSIIYTVSAHSEKQARFEALDAAKNDLIASLG